MLERRIGPRFGHNDAAGPWMFVMELLPALLQLFTCRPAAMDQCLHEDFEQLLIVSQVLFQIHHPLFESALVFFLFDLEKVIVIATFFSVVFGHHVHGFNGPRGH